MNYASHWQSPQPSRANLDVLFLKLKLDEWGNKHLSPGAAPVAGEKWEGAVSTFDFEPTDVVLVGDGSCGAAALEAAAKADAIVIMLKRKREWLSSSAAQGVTLPASVIFDEGLVPTNRRVLDALCALSPGLRTFLAGDIPKNTAFQPAPIIPFGYIAAGTPPRRMTVLAFEDMCRGHGFDPSSLHEVVCVEPDTFATRSLDEDFQKRLAEADTEFVNYLQDLRRIGKDPEADFVVRSRDSALASFRMVEDETIIVRRWRDCNFDTAFLDADLLMRYAIAGVKRIALGADVILLEHQLLDAICVQYGLDLHRLDSGI